MAQHQVTVQVWDEARQQSAKFNCDAAVLLGSMRCAAPEVAGSAVQLGGESPKELVMVSSLIS